MMLALLSVIPLGAALAIVAMRRRPSALGLMAVGGAGATLAIGIWAAAAEPSLAWRWSDALRLSLAAEGFSRVMVVLVPAVAAPILAYASATEQLGRARLLALMVGFVGAMELLVTAGDFVTLLIGWELVGALSWALIGHAWRDAANPRFGAHAFVTTRIGDLGLYVAAGMLFAATGAFGFDGVRSVSGPRLDVLAAGVLAAAAAKSAQLPFSPWLFSAMAGPTPVSALLHSATMVAAGAYLLVRLGPMLEPVGWFATATAAVGVATALAGGLVAGIQTDVKRVLAASTSAQYGLMFVALGVGAGAAAGAHLVTHAVFKSLLFLAAGVAIHAAGTGALGRRGLGSALRPIAALSAVGALALAAVPPLGGAWTKEHIIAAALESAGWVAGGALAASLLSAFYALRYQVLAFRRDDRAVDARPGRMETASISVLAAASLALGLLWLPGGARISERVSGAALIDGPGWGLWLSVGLIAIAAAAVFLLRRRGLLLGLALQPTRQAAAAEWLGLPIVARLIVVSPVLRLAGLLARLDDRVIDAGVRAAAAIAEFFSRLFARRGEFSFDGLVRAVSGATIRAAAGSRATDDRGVDVAVEGIARGVGGAGRHSRRLQTGLSHQYYVVAGLGVLAIAVVLALAR